MQTLLFKGELLPENYLELLKKNIYELYILWISVSFVKVSITNHNENFPDPK